MISEDSELTLNKIDNEYDISKLLTQHQQRILNRSKLSEDFDFSNDDLDEMASGNTQLTSELAFEDDFFEKINKSFKKSCELNPLTIMQIMLDYRGNLNNYFIILLFIILLFLI